VVSAAPQRSPDIGKEKAMRLLALAFTLLLAHFAVASRRFVGLL
jgi:hypothetical protein